MMNLRPTSELKFLSLQMHCYVVSKNIKQRVQTYSGAEEHFQRLMWSWKITLYVLSVSL